MSTWSDRVGTAGHGHEHGNLHSSIAHFPSPLSSLQISLLPSPFFPLQYPILHLQLYNASLADTAPSHPALSLSHRHIPRHHPSQPSNSTSHSLTRTLTGAYRLPSNKVKIASRHRLPASADDKQVSRSTAYVSIKRESGGPCVRRHRDHPSDLLRLISPSSYHIISALSPNTLLGTLLPPSRKQRIDSGKSSTIIKQHEREGILKA
ncbi:uncharacterized protein EI97DRAFT_50102 [Westerdykella ornata]|uniref:Uncharacterized protein n=1 Tax=Westerdykella ornata TaxID=318751 RepID=A0A6A6JHJ5_WESOR|nr:uncharacterized protein EI97DRAFT_50102 [Westerdykella ornata]KAF2276130.1 hypothetical protein EI97DRAFT_50102 [Westerdykella ornata]